MSQKLNKYQFRSGLLGQVKASPIGACLSLFTRRRKSAGFTLLAIPLLIGTVVMASVSTPEPVSAHPTDNVEACIAAHGTWSGALSGCDKFTPQPEDAKPSCEAAGGTWVTQFMLPEYCTGWSPNPDKAACEAAGKEWKFVLVQIPRSAPREKCVEPREPSPVEKMTLADRALSYSLLNAFRQCVFLDGNVMQTGSDGTLPHMWFLNDADAKSGNWWAEEGSFFPVPRPSGAMRIASYLSGNVRTDDRGGDGKTLCNNVLSQAQTLWGYTNPIDILCDAKVTRVDGGPCDGGTDRFGGLTVHAEAIRNAVVDKVYDGETPTLHDDSVDGYPGLYLLYRAALEKGCQAKPSEASADAKFIYQVTVVNDDGTSNSVRYVGGVGSDTQRPVYVNYAELKEIWAGCGAIAEKTNEHSAAYAEYRKNHPDESSVATNDNPAATEAGDEASSCTIDGVGWILCPILVAGANIADAAFGFISGSFLEIRPDLLGDGTRIAWSVMQGFANAGFILIFLTIIFSHLTQMGLSSYGVKRTLPRLIIAAILVNLSFFLTQIAVDLSNILGYGLKEMLGGIAQSIQTSTGVGGVSTGDDSTNFIGIVTLVIAAAAFSWINLGAVIVAIVAALITLLTVFLILALRKALIVLLVVLAPIAFVAYVLPNTKKLFDRWLKMFTGLLLVFPIIGLLYGGSLLAHTILWNAAGGDTIMQILAYVVLVVPLIATVPLLKGSLNAVGNIGGYVNAMGAKIKGGASKATGNRFERSRLGQFQKYRQGVSARRRAQAQAGTDLMGGGAKNPLNWGRRMNRGLNRISGRFGADMATRGAAIAAKEDAELLQNATSRLSSMRVDGDKPLSAAHVMDMATTGAITINGKTTKVDDHMQRAAIQRAVHTATVKEAEQLVNASSGMSVDARKTLSSSLAASSLPKKAPHLGGKTLGEIEQGTADTTRAALEAVQKGKYTAEALANSDADTISSVLSAVGSTVAGSFERLALKDSYVQMSAMPELSSKVATDGAHDKQLKKISKL